MHNRILTADDVAEQQGLAVFWHYLSQIFIDIPDHTIVERTRELLPLIEELKSVVKDGMAGKIADKLRAFLKECDELTPEAIDEKLNVSYTGLFYLNSPVFVTESAWLSPEGLNMQEQWEAVLEFYDACGFKKPEGYAEPEDHIGLELLFIAALSNSLSQLADAQDEGWQEEAEKLLETKERFINKHLGKWIGMFANALSTKTADCLSIYAGGAMLALVMVKLESNS